MQASERREFQRLRLARPIPGQLGRVPALVLDLGISGAFVEHHGTMRAGDAAELSFRWNRSPLVFDCRIAHSRVVRSPGSDGINDVSHTGVRFVEARDRSGEVLQDLIATFVGQVLAAQRANAAGQDGTSAGESILARLGEARRVRSHGYTCYRLEGRTWQRLPSQSPAQPADGFTIAAWEDDEEIATLCRTYESADEEGRRLIRLVAELSAASVMERAP